MQKENEGLVEEVYDIVRRSGCEVDMILYPRESRSIDVIARSKSESLFIKAVYNVNKLDRSETMDLKKIKRAYRAPVIVVSVRHYGADLEDDVIHVRHGIKVVTPKTLEKYVLKRERPIVACIRGNYVLKLNPHKFREKRELHGYTRGMLAEMLGVSRKAIYMYESGDMFISLDRGVELASILGEDIFEELDLQSKDLEDKQIEGEEDRSVPRDDIEKAIFKVATNYGHIFLNFSRIPIDIALKGRVVLSIVKESMKNGASSEKVEYAEKIVNVVNTPILLVRTPGEVRELKKILERH
ncbi:MAG: helix-turn-helix domain-containing protein [Desulfurococcaceae archaeon]